MKKISTAGWVSQPTREAISARTGFHCPRNGFWRPVGGIGEPLFIFEGSLMPTHAGKSIEWHMVDTRPGHSALD
ncbi:hypothetical protein [Paenarthrobacter ilicis]|uniref:Uncharacterized protein n=1 Tax=Paenarthrobacter ilicis TaxID=43665 RepID=A0ABX0TM26_9MICC|nr:hypothetical protein [Paenarthrobacter ilicis]MBM7794816.1 hypothetical protein [Paenarthrobacter ilicis]NIJ02885.1 hypothetical protein [Paenarthrobacter ilicis]